MFRIITVVLAICLSTTIVNSIKVNYRRVCYYTNWSQYREGKGKFIPEDIDPTLCTHIIFAFAKIEGNYLTSREWNDESVPWRKGLYEKVNLLKKRNKKLRTLLSVGGWSAGSKPFINMASSSSGRTQFASSAIQFLRDNKFDGLDIDWEFPGRDNSSTAAREKAYLSLLLEELRNSFDSEAMKIKKRKLLLSIAVPAGKEKVDLGYDVQTINKYADMINLMSYNFHGTWESFVGHHSALFEDQDKRQFSVAGATHYWVEQGVEPRKINLGLPLYGRGYTLRYPSRNSIGSPIRSGSVSGPFTNEAGFLSYYEICDMISRGAKIKWDGKRRVPYLVLGNQWVGYDNKRSIRAKVRWLKSYTLGGVMVWTLPLDDFKGSSCNQDLPYPLLREIKSELLKPQGKLNIILKRIQLKSAAKQKKESARNTIPTQKDKSTKPVATTTVTYSTSTITRRNQSTTVNSTDNKSSTKSETSAKLHGNEKTNVDQSPTTLYLTTTTTITNSMGENKGKSQIETKHTQDRDALIGIKQISKTKPAEVKRFQSHSKNSNEIHKNESLKNATNKKIKEGDMTNMLTTFKRRKLLQFGGSQGGERNNFGGMLNSLFGMLSGFTSGMGQGTDQNPAQGQIENTGFAGQRTPQRDSETFNDLSARSGDIGNGRGRVETAGRTQGERSINIARNRLQDRSSAQRQIENIGFARPGTPQRDRETFRDSSVRSGDVVNGRGRVETAGRMQGERSMNIARNRLQDRSSAQRQIENTGFARPGTPQRDRETFRDSSVRSGDVGNGRGRVETAGRMQGERSMNIARNRLQDRSSAQRQIENTRFARPRTQQRDSETLFRDSSVRSGDIGNGRRREEAAGRTQQERSLTIARNRLQGRGNAQRQIENTRIARLRTQQRDSETFRDSSVRSGDIANGRGRLETAGRTQGERSRNIARNQLQGRSNAQRRNDRMRNSNSRQFAQNGISSQRSRDVSRNQLRDNTLPRTLNTMIPDRSREVTRNRLQGNSQTTTFDRTNSRPSGQFTNNLVAERSREVTRNQIQDNAVSDTFASSGGNTGTSNNWAVERSREITRNQQRDNTQAGGSDRINSGSAGGSSSSWMPERSREILRNQIQNNSQIGGVENVGSGSPRQPQNSWDAERSRELFRNRLRETLNRDSLNELGIANDPFPNRDRLRNEQREWNVRNGVEQANGAGNAERAREIIRNQLRESLPPEVVDRAGIAPSNNGQFDRGVERSGSQRSREILRNRLNGDSGNVNTDLSRSSVGTNGIVRGLRDRMISRSSIFSQLRDPALIREREPALQNLDLSLLESQRFQTGLRRAENELSSRGRQRSTNVRGSRTGSSRSQQSGRQENNTVTGQTRLSRNNNGNIRRRVQNTNRPQQISNQNNGQRSRIIPDRTLSQQNGARRDLIQRQAVRISNGLQNQNNRLPERFQTTRNDTRSRVGTRNTNQRNGDFVHTPDQRNNRQSTNNVNNFDISRQTHPRANLQSRTRSSSMTRQNGNSFDSERIRVNSVRRTSNNGVQIQAENNGVDNSRRIKNRGNVMTNEPRRISNKAPTDVQESTSTRIINRSSNDLLSERNPVRNFNSAISRSRNGITLQENINQLKPFLSSSKPLQGSADNARNVQGIISNIASMNNVANNARQFNPRILRNHLNSATLHNNSVSQENFASVITAIVDTKPSISKTLNSNRERIRERLLGTENGNVARSIPNGKDSSANSGPQSLQNNIGFNREKIRARMLAQEMGNVVGNVRDINVASEQIVHQNANNHASLSDLSSILESVNEANNSLGNSVTQNLPNKPAAIDGIGANRAKIRNILLARENGNIESKVANGNSVSSDSSQTTLQTVIEAKLRDSLLAKENRNIVTNVGHGNNMNAEQMQPALTNDISANRARLRAILLAQDTGNIGVNIPTGNVQEKSLNKTSALNVVEADRVRLREFLEQNNATVPNTAGNNINSFLDLANANMEQNTGKSFNTFVTSNNVINTSDINAVNGIGTNREKIRTILLAQESGNIPGKFDNTGNTAVDTSIDQLIEINATLAKLRQLLLTQESASTFSNTVTDPILPIDVASTIQRLSESVGVNNGGLELQKLFLVPGDENIANNVLPHEQNTNSSFVYNVDGSVNTVLNANQQIGNSAAIANAHQLREVLLNQKPAKRVTNQAVSSNVAVDNIEANRAMLRNKLLAIENNGKNGISSVSAKNALPDANQIILGDIEANRAKLRELLLAQESSKLGETVISNSESSATLVPETNVTFNSYPGSSRTRLRNLLFTHTNQSKLNAGKNSNSPSVAGINSNGLQAELRRILEQGGVNNNLKLNDTLNSQMLIMRGNNATFTPTRTALDNIEISLVKPDGISNTDITLTKHLKNDNTQMPQNVNYNTAKLIELLQAQLNGNSVKHTPTNTAVYDTLMSGNSNTNLLNSGTLLTETNLLRTQLLTALLKAEEREREKEQFEKNLSGMFGPLSLRGVDRIQTRHPAIDTLFPNLRHTNNMVPNFDIQKLNTPSDFFQSSATIGNLGMLTHKGNIETRSSNTFGTDLFPKISTGEPFPHIRTLSNNRNISVLVIPLKNLDTPLQTIAAAGPSVEALNETGLRYLGLNPVQLLNLRSYLNALGPTFTSLNNLQANSPSASRIRNVETSNPLSTLSSSQRDQYLNLKQPTENFIMDIQPLRRNNNSPIVPAGTDIFPNYKTLQFLPATTPRPVRVKAFQSPSEVLPVPLPTRPTLRRQFPMINNNTVVANRYRMNKNSQTTDKPKSEVLWTWETS